MYLIKSIVAIRSIEDGIEAELIDDYHKMIREHYGNHALTETLVSVSTAIEEVKVEGRH